MVSYWRKILVAEFDSRKDIFRVRRKNTIPKIQKIHETIAWTANDEPYATLPKIIKNPVPKAKIDAENPNN